MMRKIFFLSAIITLLSFPEAKAQVPTCDPSVPFFLVDLTGQPTGIWESPVHSRNGNCCSTVNPDRCTSFEILLDTGAAMINFEIASGAVPTGSMFYQISCGPQTPVGQPICITGPGPHFLTFCKPGNNTNTYRVTSIPKPIFPKDDTARIGCSLPVNVLGLVENSISWTSVFPGPVGAYNSYLSCTSLCDTILYTPAIGAPPFVDYRICGTPIATLCGYMALCDTVRIYNFSSLTASVSPNPATFCNGGPGVLLTGTPVGGQAPYTYTWLDQSSTVVGSNSTYNTTTGGIFQLRVRDVLYDSLYCPATFVSVPVTAVLPPTANAGPDQTLCASDPVATLQGIITNASSGIWSGGAGTFNPSSNSLIVEYTPTAGEITFGQVTLTLTSVGAGGGCINASDAVTIYFPPLLTVSLPPQSLGCNNSTVNLTPIVGGGISPYAYTWSNGFSSSSITVGAGNYCVSIVDSMGCNVSICSNVTAPAPLTLTISSVDATTNGGSDGSATATPTGGTLPYSYLWTPGGQTTQTATGLSYGVYSVVVTDANGCSVGSSVVVNEPRCLAFQVTSSGTNILCNGDSTGTASTVVSGGTSPYSYLWNTSPAQTTASVTNLTAGTYLVAVTESNGCIDVASIVITQPTQLTNIMNHTNTSIVSGTDGSATANPSGGSAPYSYLWSNGGTTQSIINISAGIYSVTVTDNNGCSLIDSVQVYDPECASILMNTYSTSVSCPGGSDGTASAQILFGIPPYFYVWSNGGTTPTITGLSAGNYTVIGWGALMCTHFTNVIVTQPSPLSIGLSPTNIRCASSNDGTIELTVSGGTYPYTYVWSNGLSVEDQSNLPPGSYTVTVTDANGCTATASTTLTEPTPLLVTSLNTDVTCNGGSNGAINATITGGVFPYSYAWSNGATTQDLTGLSIGTYVLTSTDANGCVNANLNVPINEPSVVVIDSIIKVCPVPGSGVSQVTVYASGGSNATYQVSFDNGLTFMGPGVYTTTLSVGATYQVVVIDNNGCSTTAPTTLVISPAVDIQAVSFNPCIADGVTSIPVTLTTTGGNGGPLQASFDNGVTYLPSGIMSSTLPTGASYSIIVKDSSGCISITESISIPDEIILSGVTSNYNGFEVSCFGNNNGSVDLSAIGGTGSYSYAWSNSSTTQDVNGLIAGTYSVIVTDSLNCGDTIFFTLNQPVALSSTISSTVNFNGYQVSCNGSSNGGIDLSVNGGVSTYTYSWSNGATTEDISSLVAGTYSVSITDANGCSSTNSITLSQPAILSSSNLVTDVLCNGNTSGAIDLSVAGGVSVYTFNWSTSATTEDISGLGAGSYSVTITDANGCTTTASATITEPTLLTSSGTVTNLTCLQSSNGEIDLSVNGGVSSYSYSWSNAATTQDLIGIAAGSYSVIVTDGNGCTTTQSFTVTEPSLLISSATATTNFNGYQVSCYGSIDGAIDLTVSGGTSGYTFSWSNGAITEDISSITAGTYSVTVTDANGCSTTASVTLSEPTALTSSNLVTNILCNGNTSGAIDLSTSGGVASYSYNWSNGATTEDISGLGAGSYSVTITDANGCTTTASANLTEPSLLASFGTVTDLACYQSANGEIALTVNGGVSPYSYSWSNAATSQNISGLAEGAYNVIVTDANGCTTTQSFLITQPSILAASAFSNTNFNGYDVSCNGSTNGAVNLIIIGGIPGYTFNWSNGATSEDISSLAAGTYSVIVTDANGCWQSATVTLTEPTSLDISASHQDVPCNGFLTGSIDITMNGGVQPYSYLWSNSQTTQDINNLADGIYTVNVTDANGCVIDSTIEITESMPIIVNNTYMNPLCFSDNNGSIDLIVTGGTLPYNYNWSNGETTQDIINLAAGTYNVIVTDVNNCTTYDTILLMNPAVLSSNITSPLQASGHNISFQGGNDGFIILTVLGGTSPYQYLWSNGDTTQNINGLFAGTYSVIITDANGCTITSSITLDQPLVLEMPTGFSPNGDASNDFFEIHGIEAYPDNKIEIFNRWGNLVYSADQYHSNWNGHNDSGEKLPDGTYFVILKINNSDIELHGYVDLRR